MKEGLKKNSVVCVGFACSQHLAGLPGGRVGGQGLAPGNIGDTLVDGNFLGTPFAEYISLKLKF